MDKDSTRQIDFKVVPFEKMTPEEVFIAEQLYFNHHSTPDEFLKNKLPESTYIFITNEEDFVIGISSFKEISFRSVMTERTILYPQFRGLGYGEMVCAELESLMKSKGYNKMCCQVLTFNLPMIFLKLKQGHMIEGLMRNHDGLGIHEYFISKEI